MDKQCKGCEHSVALAVVQEADRKRKMRLVGKKELEESDVVVDKDLCQNKHNKERIADREHCPFEVWWKVAPVVPKKEVTNV